MPNGLELSGPAKTPSGYRAELAGSAPASCYADIWYVLKTSVTLCSQDIGYSRLAKSTWRQLTPTLETIS